MAQQQHFTRSTPPHPASIHQLSDDCLWLIVKQVSRMTEPSWSSEWQQRTPLNSLSRVDKRFRQLCFPLLFNFDKLNLEGYADFIPHMQALARTPYVASRLIALKVTPHKGVDEESQYGPSLVAALMSMPNLAILCIEPYEPTHVTAPFRTAFHGVTLPSVKELNIRYVPDAAFILRACPKIVTFITTYPDRQWKKTLRILPSMTSLRSVTVDAHSGFNWTHKRLSGNVPRSNIGVQELTRTRGPRISTRLYGAMLHGKPLQD
ncbi:hypothetical protein LTR98_002129 [Exophiala xenobiotica]|nr:hypothetical protein LTR98_002129 [Exophiala xenobiotica]KAK5443896.1 hypothetical protein LTR18_005157 [Exophiala xenobiotica]